MAIWAASAAEWPNRLATTVLRRKNISAWIEQIDPGVIADDDVLARSVRQYCRLRLLYDWLTYGG